MRSLVAAALLAAGCGDGEATPAPLCDGDAGVGADLGEVDTANLNLHRSPMLSNVFLEVLVPGPGGEEEVVPDVIELELYAGEGVFAGGPLRTGAFQLGGDETRYSSCGACLLLLVDRDPGTLQPSSYFMPLSGRLRLDAVDGRLTGALEDVTLRQVAIDLTDPDGPGSLEPTLLTTDVPGGCRTHLGRAAFDVPYEE
jgi:hypothetical protein